MFSNINPIKFDYTRQNFDGSAVALSRETLIKADAPDLRCGAA